VKTYDFSIHNNSIFPCIPMGEGSGPCSEDISSRVKLVLKSMTPHHNQYLKYDFEKRAKMYEMCSSIYHAFKGWIVGTNNLNLLKIPSFKVLINMVSFYMPLLEMG